MEGLRSSGELLVEAGFPLALRHAWVHSGMGNRVVHTRGEAVSTASWDSTRASLQSVLDIRKVYESLNRGKCLEVLRGYVMGPNLSQLLKSYWVAEDCAEYG